MYCDVLTCAGILENGACPMCKEAETQRKEAELFLAKTFQYTSKVLLNTCRDQLFTTIGSVSIIENIIHTQPIGAFDIRSCVSKLV